MTIRVGMIGAGAIADDHCGNLQKHKEVELVAVADLSAERRALVKKNYKMARDYEKWEDLVNDAEIDAVVVALPNVFHAPVATAALNSGKHVLLDKPFAMNYAEAKKAVEAAKRKKKVLMVGMNQRYNVEAQSLRAIIDRKELGEIYNVRTTWCRRAGSPKFGTWFVNKKLAGGGCMLDIGVHALDLTLYLMDNWEPVAVSGKTYGKFGHRGLGEGGWGKSDRDANTKFDVDDFATGFIKFKNEATVALAISWIVHQENGNKFTIELCGTEAGGSYSPFKIFRPGKVAGEYEAVAPQNVQIPHKYQNRQINWVDSILGADKPLCTMEQALVVQKILDAIYESSETGKEVRL
ncbi:MAG: gfo/Idh/MocA family oxidoreductase [Verrucomicrobia bacterium]|nr:gfo/Idh/MocA family oxidoreductase [Verrucomicrobiota bacterium]